MTLQQIIKLALIHALQRNEWIQARAAAELGISSRVISYKIRQFGIQHPSRQTWRARNGGRGGHRLPKVEVER